MEPRAVGLKLCGGCAAMYDIRKLLADIRSALQVRFVAHDSDGYDVLLVIQSCPVACAEYVNHGDREIRVEGLMIDEKIVKDVAELKRKIVEKLSAIVE
jgi:hypothetical protein